ncbi:phosphotransferase [Paenibacillus sp. CF384]|uniref:phosphotransferase n=1 Tax=Paenibacillus sp. CF384 TaxID=1884382 RepID=UPI0008946F91|nr:phosphotransferase [Paenibacillus sp. CF384]SDW15020.1 Phosphotransferase enzyme family protein [Paenibacillus sp. CF384]
MTTKFIPVSIDAERIRAVSNRCLHLDQGSLMEWHCETIKSARPNFVTGGVYRITGLTSIDDGSPRSWSLILKVVLVDPNRNDPTHYNYWRREIEAYESGYLRHLPAGIKAPECYGIDENADSTVWLWLEDIIQESRSWRWDDYAYAAEKLGEFQSAYLADSLLPDLPWANHHWMRSWIHECQTYRTTNPMTATISDNDSKYRVTAVIEHFTTFESLIDDWLIELEQLPRTFAHQDFYELNIMLHAEHSQVWQLAVIDWQFASISGIGEDLGRFLGLSLSRGNVPMDRFRAYREHLLSSYLEGMKRTGWNGDEFMARFGYLASFALRAVWEVPKLLRKWEQNAESAECQRLLLITELQMEAVNEVERLRTLLVASKLKETI